MLLDRLAAGYHVCWTVDDDAVQMRTIVAFVRSGLRAGHRVLYCGGDPDAVLTGLEAGGIGVRHAVAAGRLGVLAAEDSYLVNGRFDAESTLERWRDMRDQTRAEGYRALRVIGDMSWASHDVPGIDRLEWYEERVNNLLTDGYAIAVCAYDSRLFDGADLRRFLRAHGGAAASRRPFDPRSSLRLRRTTRPHGLRMEGEADLSNRGALAAVVGDLVAATEGAGGAVTVDVSGLSFADTATARILVDAAVRATGPLRVVGCSPLFARLLELHGAAGVRGLTVEP